MASNRLKQVAVVVIAISFVLHCIGLPSGFVYGCSYYIVLNYVLCPYS